MKLNKKLTSISAVALMGIAPLVVSNHTVQAANSSTINKTIMHNSAVYDKNGKDTGKMYKSYQKVVVESGIVKINGGQYYKLADKDQYIKITNIDGVERTVEHNAYVYATSTRRANSRLVKKGTTIVTYGGSYKFKNGKRYYRVGGPAKQYVKVANLGDAVKKEDINSPTNTNQEEATVTVKYGYNVNIYDNEGNVVQKNLAKGTKLVVDKHQETVPFADIFVPAWKLDGFYRIKGTNNWVVGVLVKPDKELPTSKNTSTETVKENAPQHTSNISDKISTSTDQEEATVTVKYGYNVNIYDNEGNVVQKNLAKGTKLVVDKHQETVPFADIFVPAWKLDGFYRIKGTNNWVVGVLVKPDKELPTSN